MAPTPRDTRETGERGNWTADAMRARLAAFKRPKQVLVVDELPRNAMGKVEKAALRRRYADLFAGA